MNRLTFLGTGGTRYVMITQRRHTGGLWFSTPSGDWVIDPGPGALVRALEAGLNHKTCRGVIATHRHIDHTTDLNVTIEAMSAGGREKIEKPLLALLPPEKEGPLPLDYYKPRLSLIQRLPAGLELEEGKITPTPLDHGTDCWGLRFDGFDGPSWGLVSDTRWFEGLGSFYKGCQFLVANVTLITNGRGIYHLATDELPLLAQESGVEKIYMTHMGDWLLDYPPEKRAEELSTERCQMIPAYDGMVVDF